jgi:hypothetical protein
MAYAAIQNTNNGSGTSPLTVTFTNTPVAGNLILVSMQTSTGTISVADGSSNALTQLATEQNSGHTIYLYGFIATAAQSKAITITRGTSVVTASIYEFSGNPTSLVGIVDQTAGTILASVSTSSGQQPSVTTTQGNDLLFTTLAAAGTITAPSVSSGTLGQAIPSGAITTVDGYQALTATGTYTPFFSWTTPHSGTQMTTALVAASPTAITYITYHPPFLS